MYFTWKDWQSAQRMIDLYDKHRFVYYAYLFWLLFQSFVAFVILALIIGLLIVVTFNSEDHVYVIFPLICLISWLWEYFSSIMRDPWKGRFLVDKQKYPKIYDEVNEISRKIKGPKIHEIYIIPNFNAAASRRYVFTPFKRNILILGYPLLAAVSYRALFGFLAHEIGHIKHNHISLRALVILSNEFWSRIHLGILRIIFHPWLRYWFPAFNKAVAPLYRQHEIEADKYIVQTFGPDYLAASQVEMLLKEEQYSDVIDELYKQMRNNDWEQCDILKLYRDGLFEDLPEERDERVIAHEMKTVPNVFDEHPSFAQRLALANCNDPMRFAKFDADALDRLIGQNDEFDSELNAYLHKQLDDDAQKVRAAAEEYRKNLEENPPSVETMNESELLDSVYFLKYTGQREEQLKLLEQCVNAFPNFLQFRAILALEHTKDDPDGAAAELEECISQAPELYRLDQNNFLLKYYMDSGDIEKIHAYIDLKNGREQQIYSRIQKGLSEDDNLEVHEMSQELKDHLIYLFKSRYVIVNRAYVVKRHLSDKSAYIQGFIVLERVHSFIFTRFSLKATVRELSEVISHTPYHLITCSTDFCDKYLENIPGAKFYSKE